MQTTISKLMEMTEETLIHNEKMIIPCHIMALVQTYMNKDVHNEIIFFCKFV